MYVLITVSIILLFLVFLETKFKFKHGTFLGFLILFLVMAIRYNYGNDYKTYYLIFDNATFSPKDLFSGDVKEPIWQLLCVIFKKTNFYVFVAFLTFFNILIIYRLIHKYTAGTIKIFAIFIFLFTATLYPLSLSMMRQAFAMSLIILMVELIINKKLIYSLIVFVIAIGCHVTSFFAIIFYIFYFFEFKNNKYLCAIALVLLILSQIFPTYVINITNYLLDSNDTLNKYTVKYGDAIGYGQQKSLFGLCLFLFPVIISIYHIYKEKNRDLRLFSFSYCIGSICILSSQYVPLIERIGLYFTIFSIISLPYAFKTIKNSNLRIGLMVLYISITIKEYFGFFLSPTWIKAYKDFNTIFEIL